VSAPAIAVRNLTKRFGEFTAVDRLAVDVAPGSIFAFLGANGSGKSTTIRMLIGLLRPSEGSIEVDGIDVIRHPRRVRDHIGYMGQKVSLYQGLSLRENVEFYAGLHGLSGGALEARWGALRERFRLSEVEAERPENLPAGLRQRAGLALATLHRPRILFLDEPTAGVDVHSRSLFWELIREEADAGRTVFVTTHFLEEVDYCDWASFIDEGKLIANAAPEDLRRRYSAGYRVQIEGEAPHELTAPAIDDAFFNTLEPLLADRPGARVRIDTPSMTDVFRRVIAESAQARQAQP
jgi:ABC-2 type transport system ATP-binding protein